MRRLPLLFPLWLGLSSLASAQISASLTTVAGVECQAITWPDSTGQPRTLFMNMKNPGAIRMSYVIDGKEVVNDAVAGHFIGEMVNHGTNGATTSGRSAKNVKAQVLLAGKDHFIFRYTFDEPMKSEGGHSWRISEDWLFVSGRDSFLETVAYDSSDIAADVEMKDDMRGPYNQTDWPGEGGLVSRVAWGNNYKFKTTSDFTPSPLTCTYSCDGKASWDWTEPNTIPYVWLWCDPKLGAKVDREWGIIQNLPDSVQDFGGAYYKTGNMPASLPAKSGKDMLMPVCWAAPTQMSCYDSAWNSGRLTWGATYGVFNNGHDNDRYSAKMGKIFRPVAGWSWVHLIGKYSGQGVPRLVKDTENIFASKLSASKGGVIAEGPIGPGSYVGPGVGKQVKKGVMPTMAYVNAGFDHIYRTWDLKAEQGSAHFELAVAGSLEGPSFVIDGLPKNGAIAVRLNGAAQAEGVDYAADQDPATGKLWLTFKKALAAGANKIEVDPKG